MKGFRTMNEAQVKEKDVKDLEKIQKALNSGAVFVTREFWNKIEYGVEYPTGGYFKISKSVYNKLNK